MTDLSVIKPRAYNFTADFFSANIHLFEQFLGDLKDKPCRLLEIGSYEGRAAAWMIQNIATHPSSILDTIPPIFQNYKRTMIFQHGTRTLERMILASLRVKRLVRLGRTLRYQTDSGFPIKEIYP